MVALLVTGSAISLMACDSGPKPSATDDEKIVSRTVRDMEMLLSDNGLKQRLLSAPLSEEHAFARPAFETFPEGIEVIGYDSLGQPSSRVIADYALHWTERDLWELKGNVVVEGEEGQKLYTQQLNWDVKIGKIYSNVDCKVEDNGSVYNFEGFEAADDFSYMTGRGMTGTMIVEVEPSGSSEPSADSTATAAPLHADEMVAAPGEETAPEPATPQIGTTPPVRTAPSGGDSPAGGESNRSGVRLERVGDTLNRLQP